MYLKVPHALQWGHDLAAVEGRTATTPRARPPSLQWGHDLAAVEGCPCRLNNVQILGFNGATTLRPWKALWERARWSMTAMLQWGHDLAAVEGLPP